MDGSAAILTDRLGDVVSGVEHNIGDGFTAKHFSAAMFGGRMDPLLMVDHFVMTAPTFAPHMHEGISAVTAMFEDSRGAFLNRDTLGHDIALRGGDLYWLAAASGAAHEEKPEAGARIHALQIFVDLPGRLKTAPARAVLVQAQNVPVLEGEGRRVRVVLDRSGETPEPMTLLDGFLEARGRFAHVVPRGWSAWIYAVSGTLRVQCGGEARDLPAGSATTLAAGGAVETILDAAQPAHFAVLSAAPIRP